MTKEYWQVTGNKLTPFYTEPKSRQVCLVCLDILGKAVAIGYGDTYCAWCGAERHRIPTSAINWG